MPSSVKRAEEHGDDLTVLFVEVGKKNLDQVEAFTYDRKWMGTPAKWTKERPFSSGFRTIPSFVLLSAEGKVLLKGNPIRMKKELDATIEREIAMATDPPESLPKSLKKAWEELGKDNFAKALREAGRVQEKGGEDATAATGLLETVEQAIAQEMKDIRWAVSNGYLVEAQDRLDDLAKDLKKSEAHEAAIAALVEELEDQPGDEVKAARALGKIQEKLYDDGLTKKHVKELRRIAKQFRGTKSGERAQHLASLYD